LVAGAEWARQGDSVRAEHYLVAALQRGAPEKKTVPLLVTVCVEGSRLRTALEHAEPYLRAHPEDAELRLLVASIYLGLGRVDDARSSLEEVIRLRPRSGAARYFLGSLLARELGDLEPAEREFRRYLELEPGGAHAAEVRSWLRQSEATHASPPATPSLPELLQSTEDPA
jgi:tetratricopeptide (TPR) repeat protein